ncbi:MAG TPA: hypothetical protein PK177_02715 [Burkholderiaceae bacterium]|nr:hypothetical protein [Burkholderiaceae bacterium]
MVRAAAGRVAAGRVAAGRGLAFFLALLFLSVLTTPPPALAEDAEGARAYADRVYRGVVSARVVPPKGSAARARSDHGSGTAELQLTGKDTARLLLIGNVRNDNDASFAAEGRFVGDGWEGGTGVPVTIAADGRIAGSGTNAGNRMSIEGRFSGRKLDALVEIRPTAATAGGFPEGTLFQFRYKLVDPPPMARGSGGGRAADGSCREIVYRNKLVPNLFGGTMSMVRVPECRQ